MSPVKYRNLKKVIRNIFVYTNIQVCKQIDIQIYKNVQLRKIGSSTAPLTGVNDRLSLTKESV